MDISGRTERSHAPQWAVPVCLWGGAGQLCRRGGVWHWSVPLESRLQWAHPLTSSSQHSPPALINSIYKVTTIEKLWSAEPSVQHVGRNLAHVIRITTFHCANMHVLKLNHPNRACMYTSAVLSICMVGQFPRTFLSCKLKLYPFSDPHFHLPAPLAASNQLGCF